MMPAWSYSSLTSYETCPRKHYHTRIAKDTTEPESQAITWGNSVHKALERRAKEGAPLPTGMEQWEGLVAKLLATKGELFTEKQIALTENFQTTAWFAKNVWLRAVIDVGVKKDGLVVAIDYKTGKPKPDSDQLKLFAAVLMAVYPDCDTVKTGFLWLQNSSITTETFERGDLPRIWSDFLPRVEQYQAAHEKGDWYPRPSGLCRAWCPCVQCEFNGRR